MTLFAYAPAGFSKPPFYVTARNLREARKMVEGKDQNLVRWKDPLPKKGKRAVT